MSIPLNRLNLSMDTFKIRCKGIFIKFWRQKMFDWQGSARLAALLWFSFISFNITPPMQFVCNPPILKWDLPLLIIWEYINDKTKLNLNIFLPASSNCNYLVWSYFAAIFNQILTGLVWLAVVYFDQPTSYWLNIMMHYSTCWSLKIWISFDSKFKVSDKYTLVDLGGTSSQRTGIRPPSCLLLENCLYI